MLIINLKYFVFSTAIQDNFSVEYPKFLRNGPSILHCLSRIWISVDRSLQVRVACICSAAHCVEGWPRKTLNSALRRSAAIGCTTLMCKTKFHTYWRQKWQNLVVLNSGITTEDTSKVDYTFFLLFLSFFRTRNRIFLYNIIFWTVCWLFIDQECGAARRRPVNKSEVFLCEEFHPR